jgi:uncharacterized membrane protein YecN with MAPEG domain
VQAPITALYAGLLGLLMLTLALRVVAVRRSSSIGLGDGGDALLLSRIRIHGNATEYVPLALILMLILEINGTSATWMHGLGIALLVGRVAHAQGLTRTEGISPGRFAGMFLTWAVILVAAVKNVL